jgi:hypothetical protein
VTKVEVLLAAILLFVPWLEGGATPEGLAVLHTMVILLAAMVLIRSRREGALDLRATAPALAWLALTIWGAAGMAGAGYLYGAFDTWWDQFIAMLLVAALSASRPSARFRALFPALLAGLGAAQALPAILTRLTGGVAVSPSFLNPNHLAAYLNFAALVALQHGGWLGGLAAGERSRRSRIAWGAAGLVCVAGDVATGSRGAILSMVIVVAGMAFMGRSAWPAGARRLAAAIALVAAAGAISVGQRFAAHADPYRYDRPRLWLTALETWSEAPLAGIGPGMYEHRAPAHGFPQDAAVFRYSKQPRSAHSQPLQLLAEEGLGGLILLGLLVISTGGALAAAARGTGSDQARATLVGAAVLGLHALVEMPFQPPAIPVTFIVALWLALSPARRGAATAALSLRWPKGAGSRAAEASVGLSAAAALWMLFAVGVAGPYLSFAAARYAESPGTPPGSIDSAARLSERLNAWQPFLGYRRARAALGRIPAISPPLLANAMESLERTHRLEPGDPSAAALLASLYRRAAIDLPGAGPGAIDAAVRLHDRAIELAPLDARLWIDRAAFRLMIGFPEGALADAEEAAALEPASLTARHLAIEAMAALGRGAEAQEALADLDVLKKRLEGYVPLNGYEAALLRLDTGRVEAVRRALASLVLPPV